MKVRIGGELVDVAGRRVVLGLEAWESETKGGPTAPGERVELRAFPQLPGQVVSLVTTAETAAAFWLEDARVGRTSLFASAQGISLEPYAAEVDGFPEARQLRINGDQFVGLCDPWDIVPGLELFVRLRNIGNKPLRPAMWCVFGVADRMLSPMDEAVAQDVKCPQCLARIPLVRVP